MLTWRYTVSSSVDAQDGQRMLFSVRAWMLALTVKAVWHLAQRKS